MKKKDLSLDEVINIIRKNNLITKHNVNKIALFGSLVNGHKANDIDILIEGDFDYMKLIEFKNELEKLVHKKVDIVIEKFANPIILYRAKKELIYVS